MECLLIEVINQQKSLWIQMIRVFIPKILRMFGLEQYLILENNFDQRSSSILSALLNLCGGNNIKMKILRTFFQFFDFIFNGI